jgi:hypothetical protein
MMLVDGDFAMVETKSLQFSHRSGYFMPKLATAAVAAYFKRDG